MNVITSIDCTRTDVQLVEGMSKNCYDYYHYDGNRDVVIFVTFPDVIGQI
jgi:hypothetical protein